MNRRDLLANAGATPFNTLWTLLETDKPRFVETMQREGKSHAEMQRVNYCDFGGNYEYLMMQEVWTEYHKTGGKLVATPVATPVTNEADFWNRMRMPLNAGSSQPSLTQTQPREQAVQWVQGNRVIMRPADREVQPGEPMASVRILHR